MATATKKEKAAAAPPDYAAMLATAPQVAALLPRSRYMGVCVVQAAGGWTRIGPTWIMPDGLWAVFGPGVARWGTTGGLAQLASEATPTPTLHAVGLAVAQSPNIVYALTDGARASDALAEVFVIERALADTPYVKGGAAE